MSTENNLNQTQEKSLLQLQLEELVKVGVGGKFKNQSDYLEKIKEELEFEEAMLRGGASGFFSTQYGLISKLAVVCAAFVFFLYEFRQVTPEQEKSGLTSHSVAILTTVAFLLGGVLLGDEWVRWNVGIGESEFESGGGESKRLERAAGRRVESGWICRFVGGRDDSVRRGELVRGVFVVVRTDEFWNEISRRR